MIALTCPQCGASLPRSARWRMVNCPFCDSVVTRGERVLQRKEFHDTWKRIHESIVGGTHQVRVGTSRFEVLAQLGAGETSEVFLARRLDPLPERVILKLARPDSPHGRLATEFDMLRRWQGIEGPGAAYYSQRIPQAAMLGKCTATGREALVLRNNPGYWGSLADLVRLNPRGIDPRHAVWIWRRILDILGFAHSIGWVHGDVHPGHLLVHPADHGILLIGWRKSRTGSDSDGFRDLVQSAWCIRSLLHGRAERGDADEIPPPGLGDRTPPSFASLLERASQDCDWYTRTDAAALDAELKTAASRDFGPPRFVPFDPIPPSPRSR